jgi:hypothetical protein
MTAFASLSTTYILRNLASLPSNLIALQRPLSLSLSLLHMPFRGRAKIYSRRSLHQTRQMVAYPEKMPSCSLRSEKKSATKDY